MPASPNCTEMSICTELTFWAIFYGIGGILSGMPINFAGIDYY
jgi:hypothetical protein